VAEVEDSIVEAFSEQEDWILDLGCKGRTLSLAAMKAAR